MMLVQPLLHSHEILNLEMCGASGFRETVAKMEILQILGPFP
jgi:hypothetical protein